MRAILFRRNGASPALPRRPSGLLGKAGDPISFPLRFVEAPLKQGMHGRALPESSAFEQSALIHGVTSAAAMRVAKKTSGKTMRRASRPEVFECYSRTRRSGYVTPGAEAVRDR